MKSGLSVLLLIFLSTWSFGIRTVSAQSADYLSTSRVHSKVEALGKHTQVEVKFRDNTKLKGEIAGIDQDSFSIDNLAGGNTKIFYSDVAEVKKAGGGGWGTKHWIILGSVVAGAAITWAIVKPALCDGGAQTRGPC